MKGTKVKSGLFIMPRSSSAWDGAEALWITLAGWATASERAGFKTKILTTDKLDDPINIYNYPIKRKQYKRISYPILKKITPSFLKVFIKDIKLFIYKRQKHNYNSFSHFDTTNLKFIWEQHDLFYSPGHKIARKFNIPLLKKLDAPLIWESRKWGVKRYIWGRILEQFVEKPNLLKADLILCVSKEVYDKCISLGIPENKLTISSMAVDPTLFKSRGKNQQIIDDYLLQDKFVIGWVGSFRNFHGLDLLVRAFAKIVKNYPETVLFLIGDGQEHRNIKDLINKLNIRDHVILTGKQPFHKIPQFISAFDIAVVSARSKEEFHYSPMKLREYMCSGIASLAPNAGEIPNIFSDKENIRLYNAGDIMNIADKLEELMLDVDLRLKIGENGKKYINTCCTWDIELARVFSKIGLD